MRCQQKFNLVPYKCTFSQTWKENAILFTKWELWERDWCHPYHLSEVQGTHRKSQIERDWETWMGCRAQSHWSHSPHSLLTPPDRSADCWLIINPVTLVYQKTLICIATSVYACSNQTARPQNAKACPSWMRLARCIQSRLSNECCNWQERFGTPVQPCFLSDRWKAAKIFLFRIGTNPKPSELAKRWNKSMEIIALQMLKFLE